MDEIWKDIAGYEGRYKVSNLGRVLSYNQANGNAPVIVSATPNEKGYLMVHLYRKPHNKTVKVHKLVAEAFVPNPDMLPEVNHIDGNKRNNCAENLEWVSRIENVQHARRGGAMDGTIGKLLTHNDETKVSVIATDKDTGKETEYESINAAARGCGTSAIHVLECLRGKRKSAGGYTYRKVVSE